MPRATFSLVIAFLRRVCSLTRLLCEIGVTSACRAAAAAAAASWGGRRGGGSSWGRRRGRGWCAMGGQPSRACGPNAKRGGPSEEGLARRAKRGGPSPARERHRSRLPSAGTWRAACLPMGPEGMPCAGGRASGAGCVRVCVCGSATFGSVAAPGWGRSAGAPTRGSSAGQKGGHVHGTHTAHAHARVHAGLMRTARARRHAPWSTG